MTGFQYLCLVSATLSVLMTGCSLQPVSHDEQFAFHQQRALDFERDAAMWRDRGNEEMAEHFEALADQEREDSLHPEGGIEEFLEDPYIPLQ